MKVTKSLGRLLLAIYLLLVGLTSILKLSCEGLPIVLAILAIAAGVCLLLDR
jgi:hypothetical protein